MYAWALAEEQSANYYQNCYEANEASQVCNIFANNDRLSNTIDNDLCPFEDDMCLLGPSSAVTFDTGMLPSSTLGINSQTHVYYRRKTTCSPLRTDGFVVTQDNYSGFLLQSQFYYGNSTQSNWTYAESRIFSLPGTSVPAYAVSVKKAWYESSQKAPSTCSAD
jgi:hypothetical protein